MHEVKKKIILFLNNQTEPVKSTDISKKFDISVRTVKNYVSQINKLYNNQIIQSSRQGYQLNDIIPLNTLMDNFENLIPQTKQERAYYIMNQFLVKQTSHLGLLDLCDELFISLPTLNNVVENLNIIFQGYNVSFKIISSELIIEGKENHKRIAFVHAVNLKVSYPDIQLLQQLVPTLDIHLLHQLVSEYLSIKNSNANELIRINITLHLAIIINRIQGGNYLSDDSTTKNIILSNKSTEFLIEQLEEKFKIKLKKIEIYNIYELIYINLTHTFSGKSLSFNSDFLEHNIIDLVNYHVDNINRNYSIDLSNNSFKIPFAHHLLGLLRRAKARKAIRNPLSEIIKYNNPVLYEIAVFISVDLMKQYKIILKEDEISFIAMHIGAEIDRKEIDKKKYDAILYSLDYLDISENLSRKIEKKFTQIQVVQKISPTNKSIKSNADFIICSLEDSNFKTSLPVIYISPFLSQNDEKKIEKTLNKLEKTAEYYKIEQLVDQFFNKKLFAISDDVDTQQEAIDFLSDKMVKMDFVSNSFTKNVIKREDAASTSYGNFATPNSIKKDAKQSCIGVLISKKGIPWSHDKVHVVFLIAVNKKENNQFSELHESLVSLFDSPMSLNLLLSSSSYTEFIKNIKICIKDSGFK